MHTITIANQRGGVAKTTTALNIGLALIKKGYKVLFVDLDEQANLTMSFNINEQEDFITSFAVLNGFKTLNGAVPNDLLIGTDELSIITKNVKETALKEALKGASKYYDYCIIDTPPRINLLTRNSYNACDSLIIPTATDMYSINSTQCVLENVALYKNINFIALALTKYNNVASLNKALKNMIQNIANESNVYLFNTAIRNNIAISEAQAFKQSIFDYAPKSNGAKDYLALTNELLANIK